jgi:hypothetical protein
MQHAALCSRINGHINYFGISGNGQSVNCFVFAARMAWYKWLARRSNRSRFTWQRFGALLKDYPLPQPQIVVKVWFR